jgi:hypothetical protein
LEVPDPFFSSPKNGFLGLFFFMLLQHHCCSFVNEFTF